MVCYRLVRKTYTAVEEWWRVCEPRFYPANALRPSVSVSTTCVIWNIQRNSSTFICLQVIFSAAVTHSKSSFDNPLTIQKIEPDTTEAITYSRTHIKTQRISASYPTNCDLYLSEMLTGTRRHSTSQPSGNGCSLR